MASIESSVSPPKSFQRGEAKLVYEARPDVKANLIWGVPYVFWGAHGVGGFDENRGAEQIVADVAGFTGCLRLSRGPRDEATEAP